MRVRLLSNGHGEDAVGALLAEALLKLEPKLNVQAFPVVGAGRAYERLVPVLGPRRTMPSGGLMMHTGAAFWGDLRAGFLSLTAAQLRDLKRLETDVLVVVGDVYALLLSSLVPAQQRFYVQTLVSAYQQDTTGRSPVNRYFMERFSVPERFLMSRSVQHSYVRDAPTAAFLAEFGLPVSALGNPMLDALYPTDALTPIDLPLKPPVVALLPGTRSYKGAALETMMRALEGWPEATGLIAWTDPSPPDGRFWEAVTDGVWRAGDNYLVAHRFAEVLQRAHLVLGTAGTANEQAAALGLPVVAFPVPPLYTPAFLANQRRLLGDALTLCEADPATLAQTLCALWNDLERYKVASETGKLRMGEGGGSAAIAADILNRAAGPARPH